MRAAVTLIEVLFATLILVTCCLVIIGLLPASLKAQQMARYRIYAGSSAVTLMESFSRPPMIESQDFAYSSGQAVVRNSPLAWPGSTAWNEQPKPGWASYLRTRMVLGSAFSPDLEQVISNQNAGALPVPYEIARRLQSDSDEITRVLDAGGSLFYLDPAVFRGFTYAASATASSSMAEVPEEFHHLVFAVTSPAQQNTLPLAPFDVGPISQQYPFPPEWMWWMCGGTWVQSNPGSSPSTVGWPNVPSRTASVSRARLPVANGTNPPPVAGPAMPPGPYEDPFSYEGACSATVTGGVSWVNNAGTGLAVPYDFYEPGTAVSYTDLNGNGRWDSEDANSNGALDPGEDENGNGAINVAGTFYIGKAHGSVWKHLADLEHCRGNNTSPWVKGWWAFKRLAGDEYAGWMPVDYALTFSGSTPTYEQLASYRDRALFLWMQVAPAAAAVPAPIEYGPCEDLNGNGVLDAGEDLNGNGVLDQGVRIYDEALGEDLNGNSALDAGEDVNGNGILDPPGDRNGNGRIDRRYQGVVPGTATSPFGFRKWSVLQHGYEAYEDRNGNGVLDAGEDSNGNVVLDPPWSEDANNNGTAETEDANGNGRLDAGEDANGNLWWDREDMNGNGRLDGGDLWSWTSDTSPSSPWRLKEYRWVDPTRYWDNTAKTRLDAFVATDPYSLPAAQFPPHPAQVLALSYLAHAAMLLAGAAEPDESVLADVDANGDHVLQPAEDATGNGVLDRILPNGKPNGYYMRFRPNVTSSKVTNADRVFARKVHEMCLRWAVAYANERPADYGAPRPANRTIMNDRLLTQFDLWFDGSRRSTTGPAFAPTPAGLAALGQAQRLPQNMGGPISDPTWQSWDRVTPESFYRWIEPPNPQLGMRHIRSNVGPVGFSNNAPQYADQPWQNTNAQWFLHWAQRNYNPSYRNTAAGPAQPGGAGSPWPNWLAEPAAGNDAARHWLDRPFLAQHRARELVFWAVDWKAYEDAESAPSFPVDAARAGRFPNIGYPDKGTNSSPIWGKFNRWADSPGSAAIQTRQYGNPEGWYCWTASDHTRTWGRTIAGQFSGSVDELRLPADVGHRDIHLGAYGADRNMNGVFDPGPVPRSSRMRALTVARYTFYDPILRLHVGGP